MGRICLAVGVGVVGAGCVQAGPTVEEQRAEGQALYQAQCVGCHEVDGGIGVRLTPQLLTGYNTAQALFNYIRFAMPYQQPGVLAEREYWAIVAYLLDARGVTTLTQPLDSGFAPTVVLRRSP